MRIFLKNISGRRSPINAQRDMRGIRRLAWTLGFDVENDSFAENAWYFRNAFVRANYNDLKNGVHETTEYLELFLRNVLLDEKNELHNRTLISENFLEKKWKGLLRHLR